MDILKEFSIPIKGLKTGVHTFDFHIEKPFFEQFEGSAIRDGIFDVHLVFDKRESFFELFFDFEGEMTLDQLEEDAEVVYISPEESHFNVAHYIYEFISLAAPLFKTYDCESDDPRPCDFDVLNRLNPDPSVSESTKGEENTKNPFSNLKNLFKNDN
jgi:uncharacterized protein